jgi:hypothetical protein
MKNRNKKPSVTYELLSIRLGGYRASVNPYARDKRHQYADPKIYSFGTSVELEGVCDYPDERSGDRYVISVHGWETEEGEFEARLSDRHVKDEDGTWKYRKVRVEEIPVYGVPDGLGLIEKVRGKNEWTGFCWVSPRTVSDMLLLLPHVSPLYISIHERKVGRTRWINGLTLQMSHPAFE